MSTRLKILCLHGFTSNGAVHAHQLRRLTTSLPEYDFIFPDGPHTVDIATQMDLSQPQNALWTDLVTGAGTAGHRAWWFARDSTNEMDGGFIGLEKSLDHLSEVMRTQGPVAAIWGFSQGACLAGMLCALLQQQQQGDPLKEQHPLRKHLPLDSPTPMAGVIFSGFRARFPKYDGLYEAGIAVPMMHVIGEKDPLVRSERSEALIRVCRDSEFVKHAGGHDIPKGEEDLARIVEFVRRHVPSDGDEGGQSLM